MSPVENPSENPLPNRAPEPAQASAPVLDRAGRPLFNLRLSVTDRCNLRCSYCMPEKEYTWLERSDILRFEESSQLVDAFCDAGVRKVRLTGGEPLLRRDLERLVALLAAKPLVRDLALTTNAILLGDKADTLMRAGLGRLTISLDTLRKDRFRELTRRDELERVLRGIEAAQRAGFEGTKLNTVLMRGANDDELFDLLDFGRERDLEVRFIEYMDVGGATKWHSDAVVTRAEMLQRIAERHGEPTPLLPVGREMRAAPADRFQLSNGTRFGIIASQTAPFCGACDRSRVTADGMWYHCLYARIGTDLRGWLRSGTPRAEIAGQIARAWGQRTDRSAEERLQLADRTSLAAGDLHSDPHLEMHTRGG